MAAAPSQRPWGTVVGVTGYVVLTVGALTALLLSGTDRFAVAVLAAAVTAGLVVLLTRTIGRLSTAVRRLAADATLIVDANPSHRVGSSGSAELDPLVTAVNRLAEERESARRTAVEQAAATRRDVESERNRLAALMAQLTVAVMVCNAEGRILLYNEAARSLLGDTTVVGLGRSVFGVVDRSLVTHAYERLATGAEAAYTATTLHGDLLLRVRMALVRDPDAQDSDPGSGFVLVMEDLTREVRAGDQRERLLRRLTEGTRASLASIRAAAESVLEFPELTGEERQRFLEIVRDEADRLGRRVEDLAGEAGRLADDRLVTEIAGDDLLGVLRHELARAGVEAVEGADESVDARELWLRADGHAVARAVVHLVARIREQVGVDGLTLTLSAVDRHAQLDARWRGRAPSPSAVAAWLEEPLGGEGTASARDVADRHGGEIWCGDLDRETAYVRMLLPLAEGTTGEAPAPVRLDVASRPEFYDFDLFTPRRQPPALHDRRLDELAFTVFDTETTGLDPAGGDRIVSIGAVRVVNGRVLRQETFERLVQPGRSVPRLSTQIHGITAEMLSDAPTVEEVLPAFVRFCEDTVLVGHNVGFDLQFLEMAGSSVGIEITQPALDTLLLHAALHPDHQEHTLEAIAGRLGVSVVGRHTALGDALVTAEVFVGLLGLLVPRGVATLAEALAASRATYQARVDERLYRG